MNTLISKQVTYEYRNAVQTVRAVNGVSCAFQQGQVYAIVGSSGSGKTTFLSLLAGLDVPTSGTIELDGESTAKMNHDSYRLNHVSVIYQNFNLFQHLTVLENAAYPLYVRKMPKKKADEQVEQATRCKQEIDQEADRRIGESRERAQKLLSDANTEADKILKAAEAKAARLDAETKTRVADADRREREAARTVDQARRLLADAAARLARPVPELPATNPRE